MKKLIALVAAAVLSASAVFAENTFHIGAYFPISPLTVSDEDDVDYDFSSMSFGGGFDFTHVADGGFTFKVGMGLAYASSDDVEGWASGDALGGFDFDLGFGLGGSFIHNERMTLSLTGNFGLRVQDLYETESYDFKVAEVDVDTDFFSLLFYIGPEISYTFRFNDHIGLFANFGIFYNFGISDYSVDAEINGKSLEDFTGKKYGKDFFTTGFNFQPKIGLAVTL